MKLTMSATELIDYLHLDRIHICISSNGDFGLLPQIDHCQPKSRYWNLLEIHKEVIIIWIAAKAIERLRPPDLMDDEADKLPF